MTKDFFAKVAKFRQIRSHFLYVVVPGTALKLENGLEL